MEIPKLEHILELSVGDPSQRRRDRLKHCRRWNILLMLTYAVMDLILHFYPNLSSKMKLKR